MAHHRPPSARLPTREPLPVSRSVIEGVARTAQRSPKLQEPRAQVTDMNATVDPEQTPAVGAERVLQVLLAAADHLGHSADG